MAESDPYGDALRAVADDVVSTAALAASGEWSREALDDLVAAIRAIQRHAFGPRPRSKRGDGASKRILNYLKDHVGEAVSGEELDAVSGIQEWARRVRELRVQDGYEITELGGSQYRLESIEPDVERAKKWNLLNEIRRRPGSAKDRIWALLEASVGEVVTRDDLDYVAKIKEGVRRVRELRDEDGWPIDSYIDDPKLRPTEYRLLSTNRDDRRDPLQRLYPEDLRQRVFARDNYTCQICGLNRETALEKLGDTRFYLELHHEVAVADELSDLPKEVRNNESNLVTLCHRDHQQKTTAFHREKRTVRRSAT